MFSFVSKNDAEIEAANNKNQDLLSEGEYPFRVKEIVVKKSRANNDMLEARLGVIEANGQERHLFDYLLGTDRMIFKLKHFCEALGFEREYAEGRIDPSQCLNKMGKLKVGIQKGNAKPDGSGYYPDRNVVKDYVKVVANVPGSFNDDIKF